MHWGWKWQSTPVFLPGGSQGWGSLVACHLWCHTESDTTEVTQQQEMVKDREAWRAAVHGAAKSRTRLSDFTFTFHFHFQQYMRVLLLYILISIVLLTFHF